MRRLLLATIALLTLAGPAAAQNSFPGAAVPRRPVIPARDVAYPGVLRLEVDASDTRQGLFRVRQTIPVARAGTLTLRYPQWLPGNHSATGPIEAVTGLTFTAGDRVLSWRRNPEDVFSFDVEIPASVREIEARFVYLSDTPGDINRTEMTPNLVNLQWEKMSLYPAGHYVRRIRIQPTLILSAGWTAVSALDGEPRTTWRVDYPETDYGTMVDSPVIAGRHFRVWNLAPNVDLNVFADAPGDLAATDEQIEAHRKMVQQMLLLFGWRSFDRYDFLFALSEDLSGIGLEHHRSSENVTGRGYFTQWARGTSRTLLAHEMSHSWNGKYRRGADLWAPDYSIPTQNTLLWVYEGQTSYWDTIISARGGLITPEVALGEIANNVATFQARAGRRWRSILDTTHQQIVSDRRIGQYPSWQRGTDYYAESSLVWLEADMLIRQMSGGRKSLDDFVRTFFAGREGDWGVSTYTRRDVVAALNAVQPYDWSAFIRERIEEPDAPDPARGVERGGYRLVYRETPNAFEPGSNDSLDLSYSLGLSLGAGGRVASVMWDGLAFKQAIRPNAVIVSVNGRDYSPDVLRAAITAAKTGRDPIRLSVRDGRTTREVVFDYHDGLRYPHLERIGAGPALLDLALQPRTR